MADYSKSCIYMIKTGNDTYIGSTSDFKNRIRRHNQDLYEEKHKHHNCKLYVTIRENNYDWDIKKIHDYPCDTLTELRIEERRVYDELQPTLNVNKPYQSADERKQWREKYMKSYHQNNKEVILERAKTRVMCECGELVNKRQISRHRKSKKHIELMG